MAAGFGPRSGHRLWGWVLVGLALSASGCASALATAVWLVHGPNVDAEFEGLRHKRVAVVCRPLVNLAYRDSNAAKDIARQLGMHLKRHVPKMELVDPNKVEQWTDENTWDEYAQVGKAVGAELVLGVDLEHFSLLGGQTVYQGKAVVVVKVYDCASGSLVFEKRLAPIVYPPNGVVPTSDQTEAEFRRVFIRVLSDQIARHFYSHDPRDLWALDATSLH